MEKKKRNYVASGIVVGATGLFLAIVGATGSTIVSAESGIGDSADTAIALIIGGVILVIAAIIIIALLLFQD